MENASTESRSVFGKITREVIDAITETSLRKSAERNDPIKTLYHYTKQDGLLGILEDRSVWATHHLALNDRMEFRHGTEIFLKVLENHNAEDPIWGCMWNVATLEPALEAENVNLFVASFSAVGDRLSQWRGYGDFSLGFEREKMMFSEDFRLVPCVYDSKLQEEYLEMLAQKIHDGIKVGEPPVTGAPSNKTSDETTVRPYLWLLHQVALLFKDTGFSEEREWRIISQVPWMNDHPRIRFRRGNSGPVPYTRVTLGSTQVAPGERNLPLAQVILGPSCSSATEKFLKILLAQKDLPRVEVRKSAIPFRG